MSRREDTIAAIATGMTNAGISIIRISGSGALAVGDAVFVSKRGKRLSEQKSHTMHYGYIGTKEEILDEVLVCVMRAPNTYTTEDVVEINCHGGRLVTEQVLSYVLAHGARLAEPGEFTKRAFLNGRIDLSRAEAVMDLIQATNEQAAKNSVRQLGGALYRRIAALRESILKDTAWLEAALDDPEHIEMEKFRTTLTEHTRQNLNELATLLLHATEGRRLKEGIRTVILGKPNAGKSTLLNALVGEERAIVTEIAGTTRDTLEELVMLRGIALRLIDTAGIRKTEDTVEKIGVGRAWREAEDADLILYLADASVPLDENDREVIEAIRERTAMVLLNKSDLPLVVSKEELEKQTGKPVFVISAKEETGIDVFADAVKALFYQGILEQKEDIVVTGLRQEQSLRSARESLEQVLAGLEGGMPEDLCSIDLMDAYRALGEIIGESVDEDLIDTIFGEFCLGK